MTAFLPNATPWQMARRAERMNPSVIREILKVTERPGIISLAGGLPSPSKTIMSLAGEAPKSSIMMSRTRSDSVPAPSKPSGLMRSISSS